VIIRRQKRGGRLSRLITIPNRRWAALCLSIFALVVAGIAYEVSLLYKSRQLLANNATAEPDRQLHVVTRVSLNTYFETDNGPKGFEYALLKRFADSIDRELVIHTASSLGELFNMLDSERADFASAGLTPTEHRKKRYLFSNSYLQDQTIVVYKVGSKRPRKYADLADRDIVVVANSSHSSMLNQIREQEPGLAWRELENVNFHELLKWVEDGDVDYTVIDSSEFALHQGAFPSLKRAMDLGEEQSVGWMFSKNREGKTLQKKANRFIDALAEKGTLAKLQERHFGQTHHVNQVAANEFAKNIRKRLPQYLPSIKRIAEEMQMDWQLLAAISYQESGWNPQAKSPTGVRGMMMLTLPTAKELGVVNRLDVHESLTGGALYYQRLKRQLPDRIQEPDRSWLALAAYNVGAGHLEDARRITEHRGGDPDSWFHVKESLPLLTNPEWYRKTRYGYARGYEPVRYVQQVRHYYNVLRWHDLSRLSQQEIANDNRTLTEKLNATPVSFPLAALDSFNAQISEEPSSEQLINQALQSEDIASMPPEPSSVSQPGQLKLAGDNFAPSELEPVSPESDVSVQGDPAPVNILNDSLFDTNREKKVSAL